MTSRFWQISIREILILTVAVAAVVAMLDSKRGYTPSEFLTSLDSKQIITNACDLLDLDYTLLVASNGQVQQLKHSAWREAVFEVQTADIDRFVDLVPQVAAESLHTTCPQYSGTTAVAIQRRASMNARNFTYDSRKTHGVVSVRVIKETDQRALVLIRVDESEGISP
ncbi:hypothetical protein [Aeoliella mucimassa]|uniref:Uncharacterized protein n=1 Tax=Aeoliella mucimassa TaxID=2527972 RepID=A0A518AI11_9BACT|nr:hypothetical protein [Aeoliella mucimassa]QDU54359.1 hypothetical protein Pan181_05400 [Aeoliella mucimassa]